MGFFREGASKAIGYYPAFGVGTAKAPSLTPNLRFFNDKTVVMVGRSAFHAREDV
jgi:hypothetical protein